MAKKQLTGYLRASAEEFTDDLNDPSSDAYKKKEIEMREQVREERECSLLRFLLLSFSFVLLR